MKRAFLSLLACFSVASAEPILNLFKLGIGDMAEFKSVAQHNINTSIASQDDANAMYLAFSKGGEFAYIAELYAGKAEYENHRKSEQFKRFLSSSPRILAGEKIKFNLAPQILLQKPFTQNQSTINNLVVVDVKEGFLDEFKSIVIDEMTHSLQERERGAGDVWRG